MNKNAGLELDSPRDFRPEPRLSAPILFEQYK